LIGCETGTNGERILVETDSFARAMLELGAEGVMVTESRVWADSAQNISEDIDAQLKIAKTFPDALQSARAKLMQASDPSGLEYTYYGSPAAKLIVPSS
jgi:hypothetical protein